MSSQKMYTKKKDKVGMQGRLQSGPGLTGSNALRRHHYLKLPMLAIADDTFSHTCFLPLSLGRNRLAMSMDIEYFLFQPKQPALKA